MLLDETRCACHLWQTCPGMLKCNWLCKWDVPKASARVSHRDSYQTKAVLKEPIKRRDSFMLLETSIYRQTTSVPIKIIHLYSPGKASKVIKWAVVPYSSLGCCVIFNTIYFYISYWSPPTLLEIFLLYFFSIKGNNSRKKQENLILKCNFLNTANTHGNSIYGKFCFYNLEVIWLQKNVKMPAYENSHKKSQKINRKLEKNSQLKLQMKALFS